MEKENSEGQNTEFGAAKNTAVDTKKYSPDNMPKGGALKYDGPVDFPPVQLPKLTKEMEKRLKQIKAKVEKFSKDVRKKFDKYIVGVALLPPPKPREGEKINKELISVLVLVDDSDSKKMPKFELKGKLIKIIDETAKANDKNLIPEVVILSELWQSCFDGKYELLSLVAMSAPVYDMGMLQAIKIAEIHKTMALKKFEKYIVSYVLAGSLVQGRATKTSDIDVWIVIDDTDVKRMTRVELKDKLRAIIIGMGIEAGEITQIRNKLNIQVYILTEFWDSLKEANPIIFTLLRDGVPFYDRGIFMPWKQLLKMGKIRPSIEAIDMFMNSGEQMIKRAKATLNAIGMEDIYYAILTPSQAALMLYGVPPPAPRETPELMREVFVKKEGLLEEKYIKILERVIDVRKDIEHGTKKEIAGKEIDALLKEAKDYLDRINRLFKEIEKRRSQDDIVHIYETACTIARDVLKSEGIENVRDSEIAESFDSNLVEKAKIPVKFLRVFKEVCKAKKDYDSNRLSKVEIEKTKKVSQEFIKFMVEYLQRKRGRELERAKIRVKYGDSYGEVLLLEKEAFITYDLDKEKKEIAKASVKEDGSFGNLSKTSLEELEKAIASANIPPKVFIKEAIFEDLKKIFGKNVEILVSY